MINEHLEELIPPHCCDSLKKYILNGVSPLLEGKPIGIINRIATLNPSCGICARIPPMNCNKSRPWNTTKTRSQ